uniref:Protein kinase domain-containing protein n=1 Tax=Astatotilapia calliptera TaxID=8154 RepID=A0A3P8QSJ3_ASTCA
MASVDTSLHLEVLLFYTLKKQYFSDELEIVEGSFLGNHYKVEDFLGEGGFGIVAKCRDTKTNQAVAIKVNKNRTDILEQAKKEIFILEQGWIQMPPTLFNGTAFSLTENQCLWDYIGDPNNRRLPISEVRPILGQLTNALSHLGSLGIVHTDLKPGNIMVVKRYESPVKVRLIDFGLACPASAVMPGDRVGTVGYSAPEVMLGLPYNEPPDHVLDSGVYTEDYFTKDNYNYNQQRWTFKTAQQFKYETGYESLETRYIKLTRLDDLEQIMMFRRGPEDGQRLFVRLIKEMLALDPHQRITPSQVLRHPFFNPGLSNRFPSINIERPYRVNSPAWHLPPWTKVIKTQTGVGKGY